MLLTLSIKISPCSTIAHNAENFSFSLLQIHSRRSKIPALRFGAWINPNRIRRAQNPACEDEKFKILVTKPERSFSRKQHFFPILQSLLVHLDARNEL